MPPRAKRSTIHRRVGSASAAKTSVRSAETASATIRASQQPGQALQARVPASVVLRQRFDSLFVGECRKAGLHHAQPGSPIDRLEEELDQGERALLRERPALVVLDASRLPAPGEVAGGID